MFIDLKFVFSFIFITNIINTYIEKNGYSK